MVASAQKEARNPLDRQTRLDKLSQQTFDLLVVGGGATGAGIALDACSRGLKVALVEASDFSAGTSSRSTKLIHGGVRYLERAVLDLDYAQYELVREALAERALLLKLAPHLTRTIALLTPLYHRFSVPYYYAGLKMYDWVAGTRGGPRSHYVSASKALEQCPVLKADGLRGGVVYYDGQFDDARMNLAIVLKAAELGAVVANHVAVTALEKSGGCVSGAKVQDTFTGRSLGIRARCIVNATGPLSDTIRRLDNPDAPALLKASSGAHIVLDRRFSVKRTGLLIPQTEDGRVLFLLPWLGHTLVGTTDNPAQVEAHPKATQADVDYILRQLRKYFSIQVQEKDILARWSGLRPLVQQSQTTESTAKISREHAIETAPSGLVSIIGGKWTTYRRMALETVDEAIRSAGLAATGPSQTHALPLVGAENFNSDQAPRLHRALGWAEEQCRYLSRAYGSRMEQVVELARSGHGALLCEGHPHLEAEVLYAARNEMACTSLDVLARRLRLAFIDEQAARKALPRVQALLAQEFQWDEERTSQDRIAFESFFGLGKGLAPGS